GGGPAAAVGEDFPARRFAFARDAAGVEGHDDALRAVVAGGLGHEFRAGDRGAVDGDLVGTRVQQALHIGHLAHAAADRQGNEDLARHGLDDGQDQVAVVGRGRDVEEGELVGALFVIAPGDLHRVAGVGQVDEVHALYHPPGVDVQAGDDAAAQTRPA